MQNPNQNQSGPNSQVQNQPGQQQQGPNGQGGMAPDPINVLQNLSSLTLNPEPRNQMNIEPLGPMQKQVLGPNPRMGLQGQTQQGPIVSQGQPQITTNLLDIKKEPDAEVEENPNYCEYCESLLKSNVYAYEVHKRHYCKLNNQAATNKSVPAPLPMP